MNRLNNYLEKRIQKLSLDKDQQILKMDLYSTMIPFLLSKERFIKNIDIRDFTDRLNLNKEMKDYLFASRTQIVARMVREIDSFDDSQMHENVNFFKKYVLDHKENSDVEKNNRNSSRQSKDEEKIVKMINKYSRNKGKGKDE